MDLLSELLAYNVCTPDLIDDKLDVSSLSNESGVFSDYHGNSQCSSPVESEDSYIDDILQDVPLQPLDENNSKSQTILPHHNCGTTQHVFDSPNHDINKQSSSDKWYVNGDPNIAATEHYHTVATGYNVTQRQLIQSVKYSTTTTTTLSQSTNSVSKPKRKRIINSIQRNAANKRERKRMMNLNSAFDALKEKVPTFSYEGQLSRIETLKLTMTYISFMTDLLQGVDLKHVTLHPASKHLNTIRRKH